MSLCLAGLRYSSACHVIPVTQVFKKVALSSGLLIRGFGVQVPGGAPPVLTWGFTPRSFFCVRFVHLVARAHGPSNPGLVKTARPAPDAGVFAPGTVPSRTVGAAPSLLDQWSRPSPRLDPTAEFQGTTG
jgi:hypothetical protein